MTTLRDLLNDFQTDTIKVYGKFEYDDEVELSPQQEEKLEELLDEFIQIIKDRLIGD